MKTAESGINKTKDAFGGVTKGIDQGLSGITSPPSGGGIDLDQLQNNETYADETFKSMDGAKEGLDDLQKEMKKMDPTKLIGDFLESDFSHALWSNPLSPNEPLVFERFAPGQPDMVRMGNICLLSRVKSFMYLCFLLLGFCILFRCLSPF